MHEENFLCSCLRKDGEDKKEEKWRQKGKLKKKWEEEKEENETVIVKRRCVNRRRIRRVVVMDGSCGLSDCDSVTRTRLPVVNDVLVSPSSAAAGMCEGVSSDSDGEVVDPQSFSISKKALVCLCGESRRDELRRVASKKRLRVPEEG